MWYYIYGFDNECKYTLHNVSIKNTMEPIASFMIIVYNDFKVSWIWAQYSDWEPGRGTSPTLPDATATGSRKTPRESGTKKLRQINKTSVGIKRRPGELSVHGASPRRLPQDATSINYQVFVSFLSSYGISFIFLKPSLGWDKN